jgi:hypothetical protein
LQKEGEKVNKGIIKDNKVYCNQGHHNYKVIDYKEVEIEGKKYTKYTARCKECGEEFYYFAKITLANTEYFAFDENEEVEIKENKKECKDNE